MYILEGEQNLASIVNTISDLKNVKFLEIDSIPEQPDINCVLKVNIEKQKIWWEKIEENDSLEMLKEEKIKFSKAKLASYLQENPLYSNVHNNIYDYYTVTEEKQNLLTSEFMSYQALKSVGVETNLTWNAQGKPCETWTEQEGIQLIGEIRAYVKPLIEYQQKKEILIQNAKTREEIENIIINYEEAHDTSVKDDMMDN